MVVNCQLQTVVVLSTYPFHHAPTAAMDRRQGRSQSRAGRSFEEVPTLDGKPILSSDHTKIPAQQACSASVKSRYGSHYNNRTFNYFFKTTLKTNARVWAGVKSLPLRIKCKKFDKSSKENVTKLDLTDKSVGDLQCKQQTGTSRTPTQHYSTETKLNTTVTMHPLTLQGWQFPMNEVCLCVLPTHVTDKITAWIIHSHLGPLSPYLNSNFVKNTKEVRRSKQKPTT